MLLSSSLEPAGPKSKAHYLVLHHDNRRELIKLPNSYSALKKEVKRLYNLNSDGFYLESKELNICAGERIRIPEDAWADLAELLGNVYVVQWGAKKAVSGRESVEEVVLDDVIHAHPESGPEPDSLNWTRSSQVSTTNQGLINLGAPLVSAEFLVINLGEIAYGTRPSSADKFELRVLDEGKNIVLTIGILPSQGSAFVASKTSNYSFPCPLDMAFTPTRGLDHCIFIHIQQMTFLVHFDAHIVATLEVPAHSPLTAIVYDLGNRYTFNGPVSAHTHSGLSHFRNSFGPLDSMLKTDQRLYLQLVACDRRKSAHTLWSLAKLRTKTILSEDSMAVPKWRGHKLPIKEWTDFEWDLKPFSMFVLRYHLEKDASMGDTLSLSFGPTGGNLSLQIRTGVNNEQVGYARFHEHNNKRKWEKYQGIDLERPHSMITAGDHSIALVIKDGVISVMFDFTQSAILHRTTILDRKPREVMVELQSYRGAIDSAEVDVYEFVL